MAGSWASRGLPAKTTAALFAGYTGPQHGHDVRVPRDAAARHSPCFWAPDNVNFSVRRRFRPHQNKLLLGTRPFISRCVPSVPLSSDVRRNHGVLRAKLDFQEQIRQRAQRHDESCSLGWPSAENNFLSPYVGEGGPHGRNPANPRSNATSTFDGDHAQMLNAQTLAGSLAISQRSLARIPLDVIVPPARVCPILRESGWDETPILRPMSHPSVRVAGESIRRKISRTRQRRCAYKTAHDRTDLFFRIRAEVDRKYQHTLPDLPTYDKPFLSAIGVFPISCLLDGLDAVCRAAISPHNAGHAGVHFVTTTPCSRSCRSCALALTWFPSRTHVIVTCSPAGRLGWCHMDERTAT